MDALATITTALAALIPDPLERWLAGGGNITVIIAALVALGFYALTRPAGQQEGDQ